MALQKLTLSCVILRLSFAIPCTSARVIMCMIVALEPEKWPIGIRENWQRSIKIHLAVRSLSDADLQAVFDHACIHTQTDVHARMPGSEQSRILRLVREDVTIC